MADSQEEQPVVCVFCASSPGNNPNHMKSARTLGQSLHENSYRLVYGGGTMGLMGEVSQTLVSLSGPKAVHGIIPRALIRTEKNGTLRNGEAHSDTNSPAQKPKIERAMSKEELETLEKVDSTTDDPDKKIVPFLEFGATTIVPDMHTRKQMMAQAVQAGGPGSGFVILAGGFGTMEELLEMVTWNQLGIHKLPVVVVNIDGYWDHLIELVKHSIEAGFIGEANRGILVEVKSIDDVVPALKNYQVAEGRFKLDWSKT